MNGPPLEPMADWSPLDAPQGGLLARRMVRALAALVLLGGVLPVLLRVL